MVRKYYNHTNLRHSLTYKTKCNIIKLFFLEEMGGPEKGRFGGLITTDKHLGAGTSTGAATTGRASHSPLFYSYISSHWYVEGWVVYLRIPIFRRMRYREELSPPIFPLVTDSLHLHFHFRIINQFSTLRLISNIF